MKITPDTNVLVRAATEDDPVQTPIAKQTLLEADTIAITAPTLCEFVWVLARGYRRSPSSIASSIRTLIDCDTVRVDRPAAEAGLLFLEKGGDFADGVIAFEGRRLGGDTFVSFDRGAIALNLDGGGKCRFLSDASVAPPASG